MIQREVVVRLVTPAFLGRADQSSEWRTPPFKALLRQWWRVVVAEACGYRWEAVRESEGVLFGHAWLTQETRDGRRRTWAMKSPLTLRVLPRWRAGNLEEWKGDLKVHHPAAGKGAGGVEVGSQLYLGYGPLISKGGTRLKASPALVPQEEATLRLAWHDGTSVRPLGRDVGDVLDDLLGLIHLLATVGGRSRNGWGALELLDGEHPILRGQQAERELLERYARAYTQCLELDWPHAVGKDDGKGLLVWRTRETYGRWFQAMQELARVKIAFRTRLAAGSHGELAERHVLAYPVTKHAVGAWGPKARLANQLRFKVRREPDGRYRGWAFHLPCAVPAALRRKLNEADRKKLRDLERKVWPKVHESLDREMERAYP